MLSISDTQQKCSLQWPIDDYVLHMVVRRGPVVSKRREGLYVQAKDLTGLVFRMALVEASQISERHEDFDGDGLVGVWQLVGSTGMLKLVKTCENKTSGSVKAFLLEPASAVKARYESALAGNKDDDVKDSVVQSASSAGEMHET